MLPIGQDEAGAGDAGRRVVPRALIDVGQGARPRLCHAEGVGR